MKGDYVVVRFYGGEPALVRVWEIEGDIIYVTNDKNFTRLAAGVTAAPPFGQPRARVYAADPMLLQEYTDRHLTADEFWQRVQPYQPERAQAEPTDAAQGSLLQLPVFHLSFQRLLARAVAGDEARARILVFDGTLRDELRD